MVKLFIKDYIRLIYINMPQTTLTLHWGVLKLCKYRFPVLAQKFPTFETTVSYLWNYSFTPLEL